MDRWAHLTPEQKQQAREVFGRMQQLLLERRPMVRTAIRDLSAMPPEQREQILRCSDVATLNGWLKKAASVASAEHLFA